MDNHLLKRRLVGAAVLVALAVIFIPMILSGGRDEMPLFGSNIPDKPRAIEKLKSMEIPKAGKPPISSKDSRLRIPVETNLPAADIESKTPTQAASKQAEKKEPKLPIFNKKSDKPKAWVVQVGSFGKRSNALSLQKRLRKHHYAAFVEFVKTGDSGVYRLRVGPEVRRQKAESLARQIEKELGIKGVVMSHP